MDDHEGELIDAGKPPFFLRGRIIYREGREWKHPDGSHSLELNFPVCEVNEWIKEPQAVLDLLNAGAAAT